MRALVKKCLDEVRPLSILRFANRTACFISTYYAGFTGSDISAIDKEYKTYARGAVSKAMKIGLSDTELAYTQRQYKSHRMLPPDFIREIMAILNS